MNRLTSTCVFAVAMGLGLAGGAQASLISPASIQVVPTGSTSFTVGQAGATATFEVRVTGMQSLGESLSSYDFGIAYDPAVMTLTNFSGFGAALGDEAFGDVLNAGPADTGNTDWNYQTFINNPPWNPGDFNGTSLGVPTKDPAGSPPYWEGSLRFSQLSLLDDAALKGLQNDDFLLFGLTFDVDTQVAGSTAIAIIDDRDYAGFTLTQGVDTGLLDYKYGKLPIVDNYYLQRLGSGVTVAPAAAPLPATLLLMLGALLPLASMGRRRRA